MGNYISIDIELEAIKNFLSKTLEAVDSEKADICEREEAGEFHDGLDDFSNAMFLPLEHEAIAIRAVLYEINALVEWELGSLAVDSYRESPRHATKPKFLCDVPIGEASSVKLVYDLPIGELYRLIEQYYQIKLSDIPGFAEVHRVRQAVNAFKHRKSFKDHRKDLGSKPLERFEPTRANAYEAIDGARSFLRALWKQSLSRPHLFCP